MTSSVTRNYLFVSSSLEGVPTARRRRTASEIEKPNDVCRALPDTHTMEPEHLRRPVLLIATPGPPPADTKVSPTAPRTKPLLQQQSLVLCLPVISSRVSHKMPAQCRLCLDFDQLCFQTVCFHN